MRAVKIAQTCGGKVFGPRPPTSYDEAVAIDEQLKLKNWCILPWTHAFIDPQGKVKPCCRFRGSEVPNSHNLAQAPLQELFAGPIYSSVREQMLASHPPAGCQRCWEEESAGKGLSLRQNHNRRWEELLTPQWDGQPQISFIEVGLSNQCNLKCRMCDSRYSSKWIKDEVHLYGKAMLPNSTPDFSLAAVQANLPHLRHLKFTGGEPLLNVQHQQILEQLTASGRSGEVSLNYSTNTTIWPTDGLMDLWLKFRRVEIALSIDGVGSVNDYVRHPSQWSQVEAVARRFFELAERHPHLNLGLRPSVSAYNLTNMPKLLHWWLGLCAEFPQAGERACRWVSLTHVTLPEILSLQVLPSPIKQKWQSTVLSELSDLPPKMQEACRSLVRYMMASDESHLFPRLIKFSETLDSLRGEHLATICPEFYAVQPHELSSASVR